MIRGLPIHSVSYNPALRQFRLRAWRSLNCRPQNTNEPGGLIETELASVSVARDSAGERIDAGVSDLLITVCTEREARPVSWRIQSADVQENGLRMLRC